MLWTELLQPSQVSFMNEIIGQVPEIHGARDAFVAVLQDLADKADPPKYKFYVLMDGDVFGTNDAELAMTYDESSDGIVDVVEGSIDTIEIKQLTESGEI